MIQQIFVYLIIVLAVGYTIYSVVKSIRSKEKSGCEGCSGCDLKNEIINSKSKNKDQKFECHH